MFRMIKDIILLSLEDESNGGIELGVKIVSEMVRLKWFSVVVLADIFEDIVNSLNELMKDSPKINDAIAILMAKFVECEIFSSNVIKLLASKNSDKGEIIRLIS